MNIDSLGDVSITLRQRQQHQSNGAVIMNSETAHENEAMSQQQAFDLAVKIQQNEGKSIRELSDSQIRYYLVDGNFEETAENIAAIRMA